MLKKKKKILKKLSLKVVLDLINFFVLRIKKVFDVWINDNSQLNCCEKRLERPLI